MTKAKVTSNDLMSSCEIRNNFAKAISDMYRMEVPMYGTLVDMVQQVNHQQLGENHLLHQTIENTDSLSRLSAIRHGAIRLGTAEELFTMRRLFAVMGMQPVSYYDLTEAGIPVHSTAFRPVTINELHNNPFRLFTSLLRLDLIHDKSLHQLANELLSKRNVFTEDVLALIDTHEEQQGLTAIQAQQFITEALHIFRWHHHATVDNKTYQSFLKVHPLIADITCFKGPHINHLTPKTLDIELAQQKMKTYKLQPKDIIEGPPKRKHPILLRQTSFKALSEDIQFTDINGESQQGTHHARFGEIEQRGMALTPQGRALYDQLLNKVRTAVPDSMNNIENYYRQLEETFLQFPDDLQKIRTSKLAYFIYQLNPQLQTSDYSDLESLVTHHFLTITPITYEDFLPVSAAGIFKSNLNNQNSESFSRSPNQQAFEKYLGCPVISEFECYEKIQSDSLLACCQQLRLNDKQQSELLNQLK